ncbi:MAG: Rid family hydrolase [Deltaproteobacteria bacterium]
MRIVELLRGEFTEYWLTAVAREPGSAAQAADRLYARIASALVERKIQPVQEKLYGPLAAKPGVLAARRAMLERAGLDASVPVTYIDGRPGEPSLAAFGVQIWGIAAGASGVPRVATLEGPAAGREVRGPGFRLACFSDLGATSSGREQAGSVAQVEGMLADAEAALTTQGLSFAHVARTWIYMARLLDDYADINRVRTDFYRARGMSGRPGDRPFPASTGIQGASGERRCVMDLLAADGAGVTIEPVQRSRVQDAAFAYGSAFSRATIVGFGGARTLLVSGTASIDAAGRTCHEGDREAQVVETLRSVSALLEDAGATMQDIASATVFAKDRETYDAFLRVTSGDRGAPYGLGFPFVPMLADVCRADLLFEMEAVVPLRGTKP